MGVKEGKLRLLRQVRSNLLPLPPGCRKVRQPVLFIWSIRSVWSVSSIWLNQTNSMNETNRIDQINQQTINEEDELFEQPA